MKCIVCDGRGFFPLSNTAAKICPQCDGTGEIQQTNEEWLKSLNTDEFADFLEGVAFDSNFRNGIEAEYRREDKDYCYGDRPKIIKAWLKEVHKE
jgi:RecJ-like exonuclease